MGAIKDIVTLVEDLETRAKDRRDIDLIHKIQALAFSLQSQQAEVTERDIRLMENNSELKRQLAESQAETIRIHKGIEFRRGKRTGDKWLGFCPKCHMPASNRDGDLLVCCSDGACKWRVTLDDIRLSQVIGELPE